jgi:hypothetical protein
MCCPSKRKKEHQFFASEWDRFPECNHNILQRGSTSEYSVILISVSESNIQAKGVENRKVVSSKLSFLLKAEEF